MKDKKYFVDLPMLNRFTAYHREQLKVYANMLDAISSAYQMLLSDDDARRSLEAAEIKADEIAAILTTEDDPYVDDKEYLMVNDFLDGLRCGLSGQSMRYQGIEVHNDHSLVETVISRAAFDWCHLREKYRNTTKSATEVFMKETSWDLPDVNRLFALLAAEYARAREILTAQPEPPRSSTGRQSEN